MLVSIYCKDAEGSAEPRESNLADHLKHIEAVEEKIMVGGPVMGPDRNSAVASLMVVEVDSLDEATAMVDTDPYYLAGVWQEVDIHEFKGVAGSWVGGRIW